MVAAVAGTAVAKEVSGTVGIVGGGIAGWFELLMGVSCGGWWVGIEEGDSG